MGGVMGFKENLLKKLEIENLTQKVINSIGPVGSGSKVDKDAMRRLLEIAAYTHRREREMDLFLKNPDADKGIILVLDNDLTIYDTTVEDVAMRKNPIIKEMVSIRKIIKILNDKDVVVSRREESVKRIHQECAAALDLSFEESDIVKMAIEGFASLESSYSDGVVECLDMFAELLGYKPPPKAFKLRHHKLIGAREKKASGEIVYGPIVIYNMIHNTIKLIEKPIGSYDKGQLEYYNQVAAGDEKAPQEGEQVFQFLRKAAMKSKLQS